MHKIAEEILNKMAELADVQDLKSIVTMLNECGIDSDELTRITAHKMDYLDELFANYSAIEVLTHVRSEIDTNAEMFAIDLDGLAFSLSFNEYETFLYREDKRVLATAFNLSANDDFMREMRAEWDTLSDLSELADLFQMASILVKGGFKFENL